MIAQTVEETMEKMKMELSSIGLPCFHAKDAALLAERIILSAFREKIENGKTAVLVGLLANKPAPGGIPFVQNFAHGISKQFMEKSLSSNFKNELIEKLQLNSSTAADVAQAVIPKVMKSLGEKFSKEAIGADGLAKLVNDSLPNHE